MDDRLIMEAIRRRHVEISNEVARNRLGAALSSSTGGRNWRGALGRLVISIGRFIEGD